MEQSELKADLALHIQSRQGECDQYQMNIDNYTLLLEKLPSEWPVDLERFKGMTIEKIIENATNDEDIILIADLVFRDKVVISLKQEQLQQRISLHLKDVLVERHDAIILE